MEAAAAVAMTLALAALSLMTAVPALVVALDLRLAAAIGITTIANQNVLSMGVVEVPELAAGGAVPVVGAVETLGVTIMAVEMGSPGLVADISILVLVTATVRKSTALSD